MLTLHQGHLNFYVFVLTCKDIKICIQEKFFHPVYIIYAKLNCLTLFINNARMKMGNIHNGPTRPHLPFPAAARLIWSPWSLNLNDSFTQIICMQQEVIFKSIGFSGKTTTERKN